MLHYATLDWSTANEPRSAQFGDIYFSPEQGKAETEYVFLRGNNLPEAWQHKDVFTIIETGFGTGLNFFTTWELWQKTAPSHARLHFISIEKYPLSPEDFARIHGNHPLAAQILANYPPLLPGLHRIALDHGRVMLTLALGDINDILPQIQASADAWFLDGFAPKCNPDMWSENVCKHIARLSHTGTTLATFSAAGIVKRGLTEAGFTLTKQPGFGHKREMLTGRYDQPTPVTTPTDKRAIIIGGGLAGTSSAYALARRGWDVTLIERHSNVAQEASGNPAGVIMPLLAGPKDPVGQFYLAAYNYALQYFKQFPSLHWAQTGVFYSHHTQPDHPALHAGIAHTITAEEASTHTGIPLTQSGLWFPDGGWIEPPHLCALQTSQYPIDIRYHTEALTITHHQGEWHVDTIAQAPVLILANALDAQRLPLTAHLPLRRIRGQLTYMRSSTASANLKAVLCGEGYITPALNNIHCTGSTFQPDDNESALREEDHQANLNRLHSYLPLHQDDITGGRVSFRATCPDRRPMIGTLGDGLYASLGHGSRGIISTPLGAELLACQITGEPLPLTTKLADALSPLRYNNRKTA